MAMMLTLFLQEEVDQMREGQEEEGYWVFHRYRYQTHWKMM
jgi:hypothetical protein